MRHSITFFVMLALPSIGAADAEGAWTLSVTDGDRTLRGTLEIEKSQDGFDAFLEGGPATVELEGDEITIVADSRDIRGFIFNRRMTGKIGDNYMSGTYVQEGEAAQKEDGGPWHAIRQADVLREIKKATPVDLSGTWTATQDLDFRKYTMALTTAGEQWLESYLPYYDQPDVRCNSIGLPALTTYSFPFEIIKSENRFTIIYEYQSRVRRIWMDGYQPNEFMPASRMGHSNGRWDGSTLVIETTNLEKTVRDFRGELISENAQIIERYELNESGNTLTLVVTVHDPENYSRPPVRRRQWVRDDSADIFPYNCDPDSFYIPMYEDGDMPMYIERTDKRF